MIHRPDIVAEAVERAIRSAHRKAAIVRALALWETWIILASLLYLLGHFGVWARRGFQVNQTFEFHAQEERK